MKEPPDAQESKTLKETLMNSKIKYRDLYYLMRTVGDNIPDMIWAKDLDKKYILVNRAICENLLGAKDPTEPIGKDDLFFASRERKLHPENPEWHTFGELCINSDDKVMQSEKAIRYNETGHVMGNYLVLDVQKAPLYDKQGKMIGTVGSAREITQDQEIQKKLMESEDKYRRLYEFSSDPILLIEDGVFVDCNNSLLDFLKISSKDHVIGKEPHEISPKFQPDGLISKVKAQQLIEMTIKNGHHRFEWVHLNGKNEKIWVDVALTIFPEEDKDRIFTIWRDITETKEYEKSLKESQERYRQLYENASNAIFLMRENIFVDCNQRTYEIFGCTEKDIIGKTPYAFSPPTQPDGSDSAKLAKELIKTTFVSGSNFFEWRHCKLDGTPFDAEVSLKKIILHGEAFIQAIVRDITQRKKIDQQTQEHVRELQVLSDSAMKLLSIPDDTDVYDFIGKGISKLVPGCLTLVFTYNKDSRLMNLQNITGLDGLLERVIQLLGQSPNDMQFKVSDEGLSILKQQRLLKGPQSFYELSNRRVNKTISRALEKLIHLKEIYIMGLLQNDVFLGEVIIMVRNNGTIGNINLLETFINQSAIAIQNREIEKSLRESEEKYRSLVNNSSEGIFIVQNGHAVYANPKALNVTGYSLEEFSGMGVSQIIYSADQDLVMNSYFTSTNEENFSTFDFRILTKNSRIFWANIHAANINWNDQPAILCFLTNIDEKKRAEQELIKKNEELLIAKEKAEESDRLKTTFLATMSHELRTPLNSIIGFSNFIDESLDMDQILDFTRTIENNGQQLLSLIEDMFEISMIESGNVRIKNSHFNLREFIMEMNQQIKEEQKVQRKEHLKILTEYDFDRIDKNVLADKAKVKQVFMNLIRNAVKFTEQGNIRFGFYIEPLEEIVFFIKDTGIGIHADQQQLIFERFRQVEDSKTRKYGGTGLGLYICKLLIEKMNGRIWVESKPEVGSGFYFTLPDLLKKPDHSDLPLKKSRVLEYDFSPYRIIIAEDEDSNFLLINSILRKTGAQTIRAFDGRDVIDKIQENPDFDLILMDIKMPRLTGLEATQQIRLFNDEVTIIALTAYALKGDKEKSLDAGCNDYISKPINKLELLEIIARYLHRST